MAEAERSESPVFLQRKQKILLLGFSLVATASGLFKLHDLDAWWRARTGELIWTTGTIPTIDPFSHTARDPWNNVEPLSNLFFFAFDRLGRTFWGDGGIGLELAGVVLLIPLVAAILGLAWEARRDNASPPEIAAPIVIFGAGMGLAIGHFRFGPKPDVISFAAFAIVLNLLHRMERDKKPWIHAGIIAALGGVWMLFHRGATLVLPTVGATAVYWALREQTRRLVFPAIVALAGAAGTIAVTPRGFANLTSAFRVLNVDTYTVNLPEWQPMSAALLVDQFPLLLVFFLVWIVLAIREKRFHFGTVLVGLMALLALRHVRMVPYLAIALIPEVAFGLDRQLGKTNSEAVRPSVLASLLVVLGIGPIGFEYLRAPANTTGIGVVERMRPSALVNFIRQAPPAGNMFHSFNYGSYFLYALSPDVKKVFIDGRNDQVYAPEFYDESARARFDGKVLEKLLKQFEIGFAVVDCSKLVDERYVSLHAHPDWQLVYLDDNSAIVVKKSAQSAEYLAAHGYEQLRAHDVFARVSKPAPTPEYAALVRDVERLSREQPDSLRAALLSTIIAKNAGDEQAYSIARQHAADLAEAKGANIQLP